MVSIITPTYNCEEFLCETVNSVLKQTYFNWELILIDDCSTDNTREIINNYTAQDSRIKKIFLTENSGAGVARNYGLEEVQGRYIAFLDSDDVWLENKLDRQLKLMQEKEAPISFTGYTIMDEKLNKINAEIRVPVSIDLFEYLKTTIIGMSTSMIDKNIVGDFRLNKIRSRQDGILWIELLKRGHKAYGLNEQLVKYRYRNNSVSANKFKAISKVWYIYRAYAKLNFIQTLYFFFFYIYNNLKRRYLK